MSNCNLCKLNKESDLWIKQYKYWNLAVCPNQHTLGSLVIILKQHRERFSEINIKETIELKKNIDMGQKILDRTFKPDWFNVQQNGNWEHHLHLHIIPRYKKQRIFKKRIFADKTFGQPVKYTAKLENEDFMRDLTTLLQ